LGERGAVVAAPFIFLTAALALAGDFCGGGVILVLAIVIDLSVAFRVFALSNVELTKMICMYM
jgi:hypothetical protein